MLLETLRGLLDFLEAEAENRNTGRDDGYFREARNAADSAQQAVAACTCTECGSPIINGTREIARCPGCVK
jgi:hypothetical protein